MRAVDSYRDREWYDVCIEKTHTHYGLRMAGRFRFGGKTVYEATLDRARVFDPPSSPDYFMAGDPHINFYRGSVLYDDIRLFVRP